MTAAMTELGPGGVLALDRRSRSVCVVFDNHPLPEGSTPARARIGVEGRAGRSLLLVDRGVEYSGPDVEVRQWLRSGTRSFPSTAAARDWLVRRLPRPRTAVEPAPTPMRHADGSPGPVEAAARIVRSLQEEVVGQDQALAELAELVARHLAKPFPARPVSAYLAGPTGVGKTSVAEQLAPTIGRLTGTPWDVVRLDLSEYRESVSVARLLGAAPGYVGYGDGSSLAERLRRDGRDVVLLLDEVDKAHPDVLVSLMNLLDAGRLAGSAAEPVDLRRGVVLLTSNVETSAADPREALVAVGLSREIVGRLGAVITFHPLAEESLRRVVDVSLRRVAQEYGVRLGRVEPQVLDQALALTEVDRYGVRAVKHTLDRVLAPVLAGVCDGTALVDADLISLGVGGVLRTARA